jgi:hypothetical protein
MPGVAGRDEFCVRPGAGELPRGVQRAAQVEATVDQNAGDAGQASRVPQQRTFFQPRAMGDVVRADSNERQQSGGWIIAVEVRLRVRLQRDDRVFPRAPIVRGARPQDGVGILHQTRVGRNHVAVSVGLGDTGAEPLCGINTL